MPDYLGDDQRKVNKEVDPEKIKGEGSEWQKLLVFTVAGCSHGELI